MAIPTFTDDTSPWAAPAFPEASPEPTVESALEKERLIKDILGIRDGLRGLLVRVTEVENENEKLKRDNEMLSVYIDNLYVLKRQYENRKLMIGCRTHNSVVAAGNKR